MVKTELVSIDKPEDVNIIIGQAHFIKTVEDIYEAMVNAVPGIKFGVAFCEASGKCLIRVEGSDEELKSVAVKNAQKAACGHAFFIALKNSYPINILNAVKNIPEVCSVYCATANPLELIVAQSGLGRGIIGVIDGYCPKGVEGSEDIEWRKGLLRKLGYKR